MGDAYREYKATQAQREAAQKEKEDELASLQQQWDASFAENNMAVINAEKAITGFNDIKNQIDAKITNLTELYNSHKKNASELKSEIDIILKRQKLYLAKKEFVSAYNALISPLPEISKLAQEDFTLATFQPLYDDYINQIAELEQKIADIGKRNNDVQLDKPKVLTSEPGVYKDITQRIEDLKFLLKLRAENTASLISNTKLRKEKTKILKGMRDEEQPVFGLSLDSAQKKLNSVLTEQRKLSEQDAAIEKLVVSAKEKRAEIERIYNEKITNCTADHTANASVLSGKKLGLTTATEILSTTRAKLTKVETQIAEARSDKNKLEYQTKQVSSLSAVYQATAVCYSQGLRQSLKSPVETQIAESDFFDKLADEFTPKPWRAYFFKADKLAYDESVKAKKVTLKSGDDDQLLDQLAHKLTPKPWYAFTWSQNTKVKHQEKVNATKVALKLQLKLSAVTIAYEKQPAKTIQEIRLYIENFLSQCKKVERLLTDAETTVNNVKPDSSIVGEITAAKNKSTQNQTKLTEQLKNVEEFDGWQAANRDELEPLEKDKEEYSSAVKILEKQSTSVTAEISQLTQTDSTLAADLAKLQAEKQAILVGFDQITTTFKQTAGMQQHQHLELSSTTLFHPEEKPPQKTAIEKFQSAPILGNMTAQQTLSPTIH